MFENILLGIIQGLTEFLPVSSSGHLVLFSHFLTKQDGNLILEVLLHLGTMLATVLIFRREILNLLRGLLKREKASIQLAMNIIIASIPTAIIGFTLKGFFERAFSAPALVCFLMVLTGLMLFFTKFIDS